MSFVVELPTQFKQNAQLPNILGNTILTGNETIKGGLQVNGSLTIGEGTTSTSQTTFESMDISTNLIVRQQSTLNTLAIESSLNVIGHSNFSDVSLNSLDISDNLQVHGTSQFTGHIQAINISGENVDISENLIVSNHLQGTDISCTNLEGTKGIIQDISLSNHMTIDQNLYISSQNLYLEDESQTLSEKLSGLTSEISTLSIGQVTVNFSFMAKSNSPNVDACLNTILPFNALDLSGCFIEPPNETTNYDTSTYKYKITSSSSGIWNFGVKLLAVNTSSPENLAIGLFKNDDLIIQSHITHNSFHLSCLVDCSTNDEIYVKCTQGTGLINMDVSNSCFFGNRTTFSSTSIDDNTNLRLNSLELSGGNFQLDTGNVILNSGDISLNRGNVNVGGNVHTNGQVVITSQYTDYPKYFMKYNIDDSNYWNIYTNLDHDIYYNYGGTDKGFISSSSDDQMNFTGQHRCFIKDLPTISDKHIGLIVCANQNVYISMNEVKYGNEAITQNESLPYVSLCRKNNDKSCFGVISHSEDPNIRKHEYGSFVSVFPKEKGDTRIYINSVGEGALWVINKNGVLESGDYITTCDISGYGMKQTSDDLKNYSVAKITMDCDFNPSLIPKQVILKDSNGENILNAHNQMQWTNDVDVSGNIVYEYQYKVKYINQDANEISQQEYIDQSNNAYIAAYVGCTYHCG